MKLVAALLSLCLIVASSALAAQESPTKTVSLLGMGHLTYNTELFTKPDTRRYYELTQVVLTFIEEYCFAQSGNPLCHVEIDQLRIEMYIMSYAEFEAIVLEDLVDYDADLTEGISGEGGLVDGHMRHTLLGPRMYFYQIPADTLYIHELMHALFWDAAEEITKQRQTHFLTSSAYKNWLRENY